MPFPFYGQDGYLRSTVVNVFDKFCLKLVFRQFIQIKILFLIQLFLLLIGIEKAGVLANDAADTAERAWVSFRRPPGWIQSTALRFL